MTATEHVHGEVTNGAAMAAFLVAGDGAFVLGFIVIIHEVSRTSPYPLCSAGGASSRGSARRTQPRLMAIEG